MNIEARTSIHQCSEALESARQSLQAAANNVENGAMRHQIEDQLNQVTKCIQDCEEISSGLSQHQHDSSRKEFYGED